MVGGPASSPSLSLSQDLNLLGGLSQGIIISENRGVSARHALQIIKENACTVRASEFITKGFHTIDYKEN